MAKSLIINICRICHLIHVNETGAEDVIQKCVYWRQSGRGHASWVSLSMRFPVVTAVTALMKPRRRHALLAACFSDRNACERGRAARVRSCPRPLCSLARVFYQKRSEAGSERAGGGSALSTKDADRNSMWNSVHSHIEFPYRMNLGMN